jgi:hypothetical protein
MKLNEKLQFTSYGPWDNGKVSTSIYHSNSYRPLPLRERGTGKSGLVMGKM